MREFNYSQIRSRKWDSELLGLVGAVCHEAGKHEICIKQKAAELEFFVEDAAIEDTKASNAIEGIAASGARIGQIAWGAAPQGPDEQQIAGYFDALCLISKSFESFQLKPGTLLHLHRILLSRMDNPMAGRFKAVRNCISAVHADGQAGAIFKPLAPEEVPEAVDRICREYSLVVGNHVLSPLIAIPVFIRDFLCIHPFSNGNGRMSRLLAALLLRQSGFHVGRYVPLNKRIAAHRDLYYDALFASEQGWHEGADDPLPFIKHQLGVFLASCRDFDDLYALIEEKRPALETVRLAVQQRIGRFTKQEIRKRCPMLSLSSVEGSIRKLESLGEIMRQGAGRATVYFRTN